MSKKSGGHTQPTDESSIAPLAPQQHTPAATQIQDTTESPIHDEQVAGEWKTCKSGHHSFFSVDKYASCKACREKRRASYKKSNCLQSEEEVAVGNLVHTLGVSQGMGQLTAANLKDILAVL